MFEDLICSKYLNLLSSQGFKSCINYITCKFSNSNSCIDPIFLKINQFFNVIYGYIYQNVITDL